MSVREEYLQPRFSKHVGTSLWLILERSGQGFRIGQTDVGAPTCAYDITLIADTTIGIQCMLKIAEIDALQERYNYNQTKSTK